MNQLLHSHYIAIAAVAVILGYVVFRALLYVLPKRLMNEHHQQRDLIITKAKQRKSQMLEEGRRRFEETLVLQREDMEANLALVQEDLRVTEAEIENQEKFIQQNETRLDKLEKNLEAHQQKLSQLQQELENRRTLEDESRQQLYQRLELAAEANKDELKTNLQQSLVVERQLESQRRLKDLTDELDNNAKKMADRTLSRLLNRYSPNFVWPKMVNSVELQDPKWVEILTSPESTLLSELTELTEGVEIMIATNEENLPFSLKLAGGYGIYKEAAKLTLEELLPKGPTHWGKAAKTYQKHRTILENTALKLGRQAVRELKLEGMHDEILRMVGALNWRTSYRQNQYYHSLEVAKLAGILANELHVDPDLAKRCGLLHDIGKGIDYRIEGSHAVISGDYADRFGETRLVCDTVMSHHNDLSLETALSYVLKSADTLSGARPGARVNLEEGYQTRLSAIEQSIRSFPGIVKVAIMNGAREVHIEVNNKKVRENDIEELTRNIARKIEEEVAFPGQIKVLVSRRFEAVAVA